MNSPDDSTGSKGWHAISKSLVKIFLRYSYPAYRLMTWQPHGTLDDFMLGQIAEWRVSAGSDRVSIKV
jgi:hypothetical protein